MRTLIFFLLTLCFVTDAQCQDASTKGDNAELAQMYKEDQADRTPGTLIDFEKMAERDREREARVYEMLDQGPVKTSNDYANAAMIFQHGNDTVASGMAVKMMYKAVELDSTRSKWLLAAAIDRDLMYRNKPQIYGTQYRRMEGGKWELYKIDKNAVTDAERRAYNVPSLEETNVRLKRMNSKQIMELYDSGKTVDEIVGFIRKHQATNSGYDLSEDAVNNFGYMLMGKGEDKEALKVFQLNVQLHPKAYNPWDSYGEILLKLGRKEEAAGAYEKSLLLNPQNNNAKEVLKNM